MNATFAQRVLRVTRENLLIGAPTNIVEFLATTRFLDQIDNEPIRNMLVWRRSQCTYQQLVDEAINLYESGSFNTNLCEQEYKPLDKISPSSFNQSIVPTHSRSSNINRSQTTSRPSVTFFAVSKK